VSLPLPQTITLRRTGNIKVRVAGERHCGAESVVTDGTVPVRYTVELTAGADGLDERGFLVDQEALHNVLVDIGMDPVPWTEPCELLTRVWGRRLLVWFSVENTRCIIHSMDFTLSPAPNAGSFTTHFDNTASVAEIGLDRPLRLVA
jgi:hypothetical protein